MDFIACAHCAQPIPRAEFVCRHCGQVTGKGEWHAEWGPALSMVIGAALLAAVVIGLAHLLAR